MPLIWSIPNDLPPSLMGRYVPEVSPDRFEFRKGVPLPKHLGTPTFEFSAPSRLLEAWDVLPNDGLLPLAGPRAVALLLEKAPGDAQLFKAAIRTADGQLDGYRVINVTHAVSCIDHGASDYVLIEGTNRIMGFRKLRHRWGCLGALQMARDAEYRSHILLSEKLVAALMAPRLRGVVYERPEEMDQG